MRDKITPYIPELALLGSSVLIVLGSQLIYPQVELWKGLLSTMIFVGAGMLFTVGLPKR